MIKDQFKCTMFFLFFIYLDLDLDTLQTVVQLFLYKRRETLKQTCMLCKVSLSVFRRSKFLYLLWALQLDEMWLIEQSFLFLWAHFMYDYGEAISISKTNNQWQIPTNPSRPIVGWVTVKQYCHTTSLSYVSVTFPISL